MNLQISAKNISKLVELNGQKLSDKGKYLAYAGYFSPLKLQGNFDVPFKGNSVHLRFQQLRASQNGWS